jgi:hypothetical protein
MSIFKRKPKSEKGELTIDDDGEAAIFIRMPRWMLDDMRARAKRRGTTVTEMLRTAVSQDRLIDQMVNGAPEEDDQHE